MVGRERRRGDQCGGSEGRRLLCVDEWRGSGRLWEMTGGVGEGRKRRAAVAWFVGGEEVFGRPGEEDGEPAEEENQKRGGRLLLKKKMGLGLGFFVFFMMLSKLPPHPYASVENFYL